VRVEPVRQVDGRVGIRLLQIGSMLVFEVTGTIALCLGHAGLKLGFTGGKVGIGRRMAAPVGRRGVGGAMTLAMMVRSQRVDGCVAIVRLITRVNWALRVDWALLRVEVKGNRLGLRWLTSCACAISEGMRTRCSQRRRRFIYT
jgi:hypothetical protein